MKSFDGFALALALLPAACSPALKPVGPTTPQEGPDQRGSPPPPPGPRPDPFTRPDEPPPPPREPGPVVPPAREHVVPRPTTSRLPSGLQLAVVERRSVPLVEIRLVILAGSVTEPADRAGLAGLTAALLTHGTRTRSRDQIEEEIEHAGGTLRVDTTWDTTELATQVPPDQLDAALAVLVDLVASPTFPAPALDEERRDELAQLELDETRPAAVALRGAVRQLFGGDQPAHLSTRASLAAVTRDDLVRFHAERYRPDGALLVLAGDVPGDTAARVKKAFASWSAPKQPAPTLPAGGIPPANPTQGSLATPPRNPAGAPAIHLAPMPPSPFARLVTAWPVPPRSHADHAALLVLGQAVDAGLASHQTAVRLDSHRASGLLTIADRVPTEQVDQTLLAYAAVLERLRTVPASEDELALAKGRIDGNFLLNLGRLEGLAHLQAIRHGAGLAPDAWEGFRQRISRVTLEELRQVAARHLDPSRQVIVVAADPAIEPELAKVGAVVPLPSEPSK